VSGLVCYLKVQ